jgi:hypothetical protein
MYRSFVRGVVTLALVAFAASGCDKSTEPGTPITPGPTEVAEPDFTGTLSLNGGVTTHFSVTGVGLVNAIVKTIDPNTEGNTRSIGISMGTWNGTTCQDVIHNDNAGQGSGIAGMANAVVDLCVRVYDPGPPNALTEPVNFVVSITHF